MIGLGLLAWAGGCERTASSTGSAGGAATADSLPPGLFREQEPAGARGVAAVTKEAKASGEVVVRGRIGGRVEPFVEGRAMFMVADVSLPTCKELHGDSCPTPWDYCCEAKDALLASTATVQVVGPEGRPLKIGLRGQHGLEPLAEVVVVGRVATPEGGGALVINAREIYVAKR